LYDMTAHSLMIRAREIASVRLENIGRRSVGDQNCFTVQDFTTKKVRSSTGPFAYRRRRRDILIRIVETR
jgi:hypothetical protein